MTHGTQKQLADYLGVNKSTISRAVAAGRLQPGADGLFDFAACKAAWHHSAAGRSDVAARHAAARGRDIPVPHPEAEKPTAAQIGPAASESAATDTGHGRTRYKAMVLHFENQQIKLGMALARGLRYQRTGVKREALAQGQTVRAAFERLIDQTAPRLAVMDSDIERRRLIAAELQRLRWMLRAEQPRALRRLRADSAKVSPGGTA